MKISLYLQVFSLLSSFVALCVPVLNASASDSNLSGATLGQIEKTYGYINRQLAEVSGKLNMLPSDSLLIVTQVPVNITKPGSYHVIQDLTYTGNDAAITVMSNNVSINFYNHTLTLQSSTAKGISVKNLSGFSLENGYIQNASNQNSSQVAVELLGVHSATVDNLYTNNCVLAFDIENSSQLQITNSQFDNGGGVSLLNSSYITVDNCVFNGNNSSFGIHAEGASEDLKITNSSFTNFNNALHLISIDDVLVDSCQISASTINLSGNPSPNLVQLGSSTSFANDVLIKNSTFTQSESVTGFDGMCILSGSGCFLENLVIDSCSLDPGVGSMPASIHIGSGGVIPYENLMIKNCIVKGDNGRTIFIENAKKTIVDDCQISGGRLFNVQMQRASSCTVKNCMIFDGDCGISIDNSLGGGHNSVKDCFVYDNKTMGITVADMAKNSVTGNNVWASGTGIEIAYSDYTETFFNTACNNSVQNCSNVYPSQVPGGSPPGTSVVAGANLCCEQ